MGVTGLWTVVQPCARPIKLETLNKKRLAVDASIWIYQFLKAVRDKEGNALRNSHVVGFFRRICKLLFFGIKPVFVFDGGAPILKRQTISGRKARREGRREDAVRTAGKLLAVQMQRRAEEEEQNRKAELERGPTDEKEEILPNDLVYVDELQMTAQERTQNRRFRKKDAYHLPDLDVSLMEMGAPNDPRIMSHEELEEYARQFHTGEDVNLYDFSKIDFNGPFFTSLPASDRYNILNAARLRSRLRMGYSKEQLDTMFPDRMAFSKFQVERVAERNELTQRLMNLNGMNGEELFGVNGSGRVAGEKGKEYVLVKNDGVEGGWALGVVGSKDEGRRSRPIDVDQIGIASDNEDGEDSSGDDAFEDVPIEGLNRLPKQTLRPDRTGGPPSSNVLSKRKEIYRQRRQAATVEPGDGDDDEEALFLPAAAPDEDNDDMDDLFEDVLPLGSEENEEEALQRAIAMSLEDAEEEDEEVLRINRAAMLNGPRIDKPLDFNVRNAKAGRAFAHFTNARAKGPEARLTPGVTHEVADTASKVTTTTQATPPQTTSSQSQHDFDGPLPFEPLNLGKSLFQKKKIKRVEEEGGFERSEDSPVPLPPWFSGDVRRDTAAQRILEEHQFEHEETNTTDTTPQLPILKHQMTGEVIELDAPRPSQSEVIEVVSSEDEEDGVAEQILFSDRPTMDDIAESTRIKVPESSLPPQYNPSRVRSPSPVTAVPHEEAEISDQQDAIEWDQSDYEMETEDSTQPKLLEKPAGGEVAMISTEKNRRTPLEDNVLDETSLAQKVAQVDAGDEERDMNIIDKAMIDVDNEIYSDPEDEDLMRQLAAEAEEHARFASTLNSRSQLQNAEDYERELRQLRNQQKKDRRDADEVTHIMVTECQQLLKLFGLPYITAPMEAEAQCAELVSLGLVDGIVTDDSDIFLFGGTRVYKNMFNQAKFVECYLSSDLEKEYALDRKKVIQIAHLLGSDYTEGLPNVGPVTALEILSEFENLDQFRDWWSKVQMGEKMSEDNQSAFRKKFKRNATKIFLPPAFPDRRVDEAYLHPEVDSDPSPFLWGVPDLDALRQFLMATIGWTQERADEILVPVIRDMNRRENEGTQANITQFFSGSVGVGSNGGPGVGYAPRRRGEGKSRRMENALGKLHAKAKERTIGEGEPVEATSDNDSAVPVQEVRTKKRKARPALVDFAEEDGSAGGEDGAEYTPQPRARKRSNRGAK